MAEPLRNNTPRVFSSGRRRVEAGRLIERPPPQSILSGAEGDRRLPKRLRTEERETVLLDFGKRDPKKDLRRQLSAVGAEGRFVWTGSDEGRGVECFVRRKRRLVLKRRLKLEKLFPAMPKKGEADLEALDVIGGRLWLTGSHCIVRPKKKNGEPAGEGCEEQKSRHLLGSVALDKKGRPRRKTARALAFKGKKSLRGALRHDRQIAPFLAIPTKENGLDVEGVLAWRKSLLLGLRAPVIATLAVILELPARSALKDPREGLRKHYLDLGGLGVRDLCHHGKEVLILAGPVTSTGGPFRLFRWRPRRWRKKKPKLLHEWKLKQENPEGICMLERGGRPGLLVLHDSPKERVKGSTYRADWFPLG
jgi:hypothetical protein